MAKAKTSQMDPKLAPMLDGQVAGLKSRAEKLKMFGKEVYFLNGHMFTGATPTGIFVQVGEAAVQAGLKQKGTAPHVSVSGKPMKNYILLQTPVYSDPEQLKTWLERSRDYLTKLGPKAREGAPKPKQKASRSPARPAKKPAKAKKSPAKKAKKSKVKAKKAAKKSAKGKKKKK